jgi:hypothetical protein
MNNTRTIIALYGCETWSHATREEHRLRVFKYRVLRRIFGPKREQVIEGKIITFEELHNLCSSTHYQGQKGGACSMQGKKLNVCVCRILPKTYMGEITRRPR